MQTILVAENEAPLRKMISQVLRKAGYRVVAAGGGAEAVSLAAREPKINLLITDIVMPGMGGADLYAWLKTERPDLPVLFISGYMSREPLTGAFLKKPFSAEILLETVRGLLSQPQP